MAKLFDLKLVFTQIPNILRFLPVTLQLTVVAMLIGWGFGFLIAMVKRKKIPVLEQICALFVSLMRGTPVIVQLYISYFGIPILLKYINYYQGTNFNVNAIPSIVFAMITLGLNQSAFDSETIRSALNSVDRGQVEAARSMGMTGVQVFFRVTFPQAMYVALPPLGNSLISLIKGTSLAFTCSVVEMTAQAKIVGGSNLRYFEAYCSLAIIYWLINLLIERVFRALELRLSIPEQAPPLLGEAEDGEVRI